MIARLFDIRESPRRGKGLFAKEDIPAGTIVCFECPQCRVFTPKEFAMLTKTEQESMLEHAYRKKDGSVLLPCDETVYLNHSCNANILYSGKHFDIVVRPIKKDEEATYDYRFFFEEADVTMPCACGEASCCGVVRWEQPVPGVLRKAWDEKITEAMNRLRLVRQPLQEALLAASREFAQYLERNTPLKCVRERGTFFLMKDAKQEQLELKEKELLRSKAQQREKRRCSHAKGKLRSTKRNGRSRRN